VKIIGISSYYHDSAAALIENGKIVLAAQEERFTRKKNDSSFPIKSIEFILNEKKLDINEIDYICFYEKPILKFERLIETYLSFSFKGFKQFAISMPLWIKEKLFLKENIFKELKKLNKNFDKKKLFFSKHHLSHAASAFYPSPFNDAVILTIDGVGEWNTTTVSIGKENKIEFKKEINFPHSLGLLYSAFTYYLGFQVNEGEYKVMGLAPYGKPVYKDLITKNLININEDGSFKLNLKFFDYATGLKMTNKYFDDLFGHKRRESDENILQFHMDIARSIQDVTEMVMDKIIFNLSKEYKNKNLCLAGGVALNCVANGKILKKKYFENIWIQPAAGDAGGAIGAALALWHKDLNMSRKPISKNDGMNNSLLGPQFSNEEIEKELITLGAKYEKFKWDELLDKTTNLICEGKIIGWFQDRMEFGPRALGNRSIIADPRNPEMQSKLNLKIKYRESFRPFAPAILEEKVNEWFVHDEISPYMLFVSQIKKDKIKIISEEEKNLKGFQKLKALRSEVPAVTHVDYSARIQTVNESNNKKFYNLINNFYKKTKCPILINTSFNIKNEPIVCNIKDAYQCLLVSQMDYLICGNYLIERKKQF
jgi:carbamoyltransferase